MPVKMIPTTIAGAIAADVASHRAAYPMIAQAGYNLAGGTTGYCRFFMPIGHLGPTGIERCHALALIFTDGRPECHLPTPVSAAPMQRFQEELLATILGRPTITGHERLQLAEDVEVAIDEPVSHPPIRGAADTIETWRQVERGRQLSIALEAELAAFDTELAGYDPSIGTMPVLGLVSALGWQSRLARYLADEGIDDLAGIARLIAHRDPGLALALETSERLIEAHDETLQFHHLYHVDRRNCLDDAAIRQIHDVLFANMPIEGEAGCHRQRDGGFDLETGLKGLPVGAIPDQMDRYAWHHAFKTWPDCHAIVRAGLALIHLLRLRPFDQGNGAVARVLFALLLQDRGIPELPLDLVLVSRENAFRQFVRTAIETRNALPFIRFLVEVCRTALALGRKLALTARAEILRLRHAMAGLPTTGIRTQELAIFLASRLIAQDHHVVFASETDPEAAISLVRELALAGHLDEVEQDGQLYWSLPGIRRILSNSLNSLIHK